jgi:perosamine synthetase
MLHLSAFEPWIDVELALRDIEAVLRSGWITSGPAVHRFENLWAQRTGQRHAVAMSSGQQALDAALELAPMQASSLVAVPGVAFPGDVAAILRAGHTPVVFDCDATMQPDIEQLQALADSPLAQHIGGVLWVHIGGFVSPGALEARRLCDERGWVMIEDACHVHGATVDRFPRQTTLHPESVPGGGIGHLSVLSFFATKVVACGEGGMVLTSRDDVAEKLGAWRQHGFLSRSEQDPIMHASNASLSDVLAVIGIGGTERLEEGIRLRARIAEQYDQIVSMLPAGWYRPVVPGCSPNWYKYPLIAPDAERRFLMEQAFKDAAVGLAGKIYPDPVYDHDLWRNQCTLVLNGEETRGPLPMAERICANHLCLPIYPTLTDSGVRRVTKIIEHVAGGF